MIILQQTKQFAFFVVALTLISSTERYAFNCTWHMTRLNCTHTETLQLMLGGAVGFVNSEKGFGYVCPTHTGSFLRK